jgi:hypothetical protein
LEGTDISTEAEIRRLADLPLKQLRSEWHQAHPERWMPDRLPRDLLVRMIAWKLQNEQIGRSSSALSTRLDRLAKQLCGSGSLSIEREVQLKPGTSLIREWGGQTHRVTALDEGFLWNDRSYASLSEVAREITGTRWSGPRFFGLKQRSSGAPVRASQQRHG